MSNPGALTDLKYEYGDGIVLCTDSWNPNSKLWSATKTISGHSTIHIKAHFLVMEHKLLINQSKEGEEIEK